MSVMETFFYAILVIALTILVLVGVRELMRHQGNPVVESFDTVPKNKQHNVCASHAARRGNVSSTSLMDAFPTEASMELGNQPTVGTNNRKAIQKKLAMRPDQVYRTTLLTGRSDSSMGASGISVLRPPLPVTSRGAFGILQTQASVESQE